MCQQGWRQQVIYDFMMMHRLVSPDCTGLGKNKGVTNNYENMNNYEYLTKPIKFHIFFFFLKVLVATILF